MNEMRPHMYSRGWLLHVIDHRQCMDLSETLVLLYRASTDVDFATMRCLNKGESEVEAGCTQQGFAALPCPASWHSGSPECNGSSIPPIIAITVLGRCKNRIVLVVHACTEV